jgi:hypothetical protein
MDALTLALIEMKRENRKPSDKNYGTIWVRRVYQINNYLSHEARKLRKK